MDYEKGYVYELMDQGGLMDEQLVEQLYREYWDCMINKDIQGLSEIMIEDYTLMHMTGMRQSKESFFQSVQNGELNYFSAEHDEIHILHKKN